MFGEDVGFLCSHRRQFQSQQRFGVEPFLVRGARGQLSFEGGSRALSFDGLMRRSGSGYAGDVSIEAVWDL